MTDDALLKILQLQTNAVTYMAKMAVRHTNEIHGLALDIRQMTRPRYGMRANPLHTRTRTWFFGLRRT